MGDASRFRRINTIWLKELTDTLRDRRTLIAMIFVPMVLYPAMMLGSLQGFELQYARLMEEKYVVAVQNEEVLAWLQQVIHADAGLRPGAAGHTAEEIVELEAQGALEGESPSGPPAQDDEEAARRKARRKPPQFGLVVIPNIEMMAHNVTAGDVHVGVVLDDGVPAVSPFASTGLTLIIDQTNVRSYQVAAPGLEGILSRYSDALLAERLRIQALDADFIRPLEIYQKGVAPPAKVGGSILGQIVPLILIMMTITGAIYPAIDLTAGERERGTLETLMVAPVPTVDLIAGKFIVVALIAMLSAALNLLSIGGTIWLGGLGNMLSPGGEVVIPLDALPWVLLVLIPLAVMFSAALLAVCSFARSFKEAQNYVMPVMVAAIIPAIVGILPGTRLEGPLLIMPVANICILARDLFTGEFNAVNIAWVMTSTTLYAGAAVAAAAKLFGQEAVLFADSGSVKTIFQRRFFKPRRRPTASQAFVLLAVLFSLNFFAQQQILGSPDMLGTMRYWWTFVAVLCAVFVLIPLATAAWARARIDVTFGLRRPSLVSLAPALCFGLSTWVLSQAWLRFQQTWLHMPDEMVEAMQGMMSVLNEQPLMLALLFLAAAPAVCEEFFFRGFTLSGLRGGLGRVGAVVVVAIAFGVYHHSVHRLIITAGLGLLLGLLVLRYGTIWPAVLAHLMHNAMNVLSFRPDGLRPLLDGAGFAEDGYPPLLWTLGAAGLVLAGVLLCVAGPASRPAPGTIALNSAEYRASD